MVQQTVGGGEADMMMGSELRGLVLVVELETGSCHGGLEHFLFPVVDGDLQVTDVWLQLANDLWRVCCLTKQRLRLYIHQLGTGI